MRVERVIKWLAETHEIGGRLYWPGLPGVREHPHRHLFLHTAARGHRPVDKEAPGPEVQGDLNRGSGSRPAVMMKTRTPSTRCRLCGRKGHFNKACEEPHKFCRAMGCCQVRSDHRNYMPKCGQPLNPGQRHHGRPPRHAKTYVREDVSSDEEMAMD